MGELIALNVMATVKPDRRDEILKILIEDGQQTLATEEGALQFILGQDIKDPNIFHLHEQYKSKEDVDLHHQTPHFLKLVETLLSEPLVSGPDIQTYKCHHEPKKIESRSAYCFNVESCIKSEFREEFLELMTSHQANSKAEPGCLQFDWGESVEEENTFYIHEEYVDKGGYDAHETTPHFSKFGVFNAKDPYSKPQVVHFFTAPIAE